MRWKDVGAALVLAGCCAGAAEAQSSRAAGLQGNPGQFFGPDAYPKEAASRREEGRVVARLLIDTEGRVSECSVQTSSGSASLDAQTCAIALRSVVFSPARDDVGRAISSRYTLPVRWVLPRVTGLVSTSTVTRSTMRANMAMSDCSRTVNGQAVEATLAHCEHYKALFEPTFARNATGRGLRVIRTAVEEQVRIAGKAPPAPAALSGTILARSFSRFRIDESGRPFDCRDGAEHGEAEIVGGPCKSYGRYNVAGLPPEAFPVEATWSMTVSYGKAPR